MQLDAPKVAEAREWLQRAVADLESAAVLPECTPAHADAALFHVQQAAEKAWKAYLFWHNVPVRKTHDLHPFLLRGAATPQGYRCPDRSFGEGNSGMLYDPALVEDSRAWLTKVHMDLRAADLLLGATSPLLGIVVFLSYHCAERLARSRCPWSYLHSDDDGFSLRCA